MLTQCLITLILNNNYSRSQSQYRKCFITGSLYYWNVDKCLNIFREDKHVKAHRSCEYHLAVVSDGLIDYGDWSPWPKIGYEHIVRRISSLFEFLITYLVQSFSLVQNKKILPIYTKLQ